MVNGPPSSSTSPTGMDSTSSQYVPQSPPFVKGIPAAPASPKNRQSGVDTAAQTNSVGHGNISQNPPVPPPNAESVSAKHTVIDDNNPDKDLENAEAAAQAISQANTPEKAVQAVKKHKGFFTKIKTKTFAKHLLLGLTTMAVGVALGGSLVAAGVAASGASYGVGAIIGVPLILIGIVVAGAGIYMGAKIIAEGTKDGQSATQSFKDSWKSLKKLGEDSEEEKSNETKISSPAKNAYNPDTDPAFKRSPPPKASSVAQPSSIAAQSSAPSAPASPANKRKFPPLPQIPQRQNVQQPNPTVTQNKGSEDDDQSVNPLLQPVTGPLPKEELEKQIEAQNAQHNKAIIASIPPGEPLDITSGPHNSLASGAFCPQGIQLENGAKFNNAVSAFYAAAWEKAGIPREKIDKFRDIDSKGALQHHKELLKEYGQQQKVKAIFDNKDGLKDLLKDIFTRKFAQDDDLKTLLLGTKNKQLLETYDTPDMGFPFIGNAIGMVLSGVRDGLGTTENE